MTTTYGLVQPDATLIEWLQKRERAEMDRWDEMWDGVLHMNPLPNGNHQDLGR